MMHHHGLFQNISMYQSSSTALRASAAGGSGEPSKDTSAADLFTERTELGI